MKTLSIFALATALHGSATANDQDTVATNAACPEEAMFFNPGNGEDIIVHLTRRHHGPTAPQRVARP